VAFQTFDLTFEITYGLPVALQIRNVVLKPSHFILEVADLRLILDDQVRGLFNVAVSLIRLKAIFGFGVFDSLFDLLDDVVVLGLERIEVALE
jgi:hypothetical protein